MDKIFKNIFIVLGHATIVILALPFIFFGAIFSLHPILFIIAAVFLLIEFNLLVAKIFAWIFRKGKGDQSSRWYTFLKFERIVGLSCLLLFVVLQGKEIYYDYMEETFDENVFDRQFYQNYRPFHSQKLIRLPEKSSLQFSSDNHLPKIDGAKALYPVYASFAENIYPQSAIADEECLRDYAGSPKPAMVRCRNTIQSFKDLINGDTDIVFLAKPSAEQMQMAEEKGVTLHLKPIGKEAFVFFTNKNNVVENLSTQNIKDIYSGKIKNWRKLGGKWQKIRPFQRNANSGSQSTMEKFMGDTPLMQPEKRDRVDVMSGIIKRVATYRNHTNAIGYSFLFFVETLHANENVKIFSIDGIHPNKDNIRDGSYPLAYPFYAITVAERETPEIQQFLQWLDSDEAKYIIENAGYTAISQ